MIILPSPFLPGRDISIFHWPWHEGGFRTPVALVESATLPAEKRLFTNLQDLAANALPRAAGPVVMCVGEVFRGRDALTEAEHEHLMRQVDAARCQAG